MDDLLSFCLNINVYNFNDFNNYSKVEIEIVDHSIHFVLLLVIMC